jgi:D-alanyl-D-alanine dipeptidase
LTGDALEQETQKFVPIPSTDPCKPSPHLTGGAVDLALGDADGNPFDMGGEFDELTRRTEPDFYEAAQAGTPERVFRDRRRLLRRSLESAGFTNYPEEWWHFDLHDQF